MVPEVVTEPFTVVEELPSGAVPWTPLLLLVEPLPMAITDALFPPPGGGAADPDPSTLMERLQEHTRLGDELN